MSNDRMRMRPIMIWNKDQRVESENDSSVIGFEINKRPSKPIPVKSVFNEESDVKYLVQIWNGEGFEFQYVYKEDENKALLKAIDERFSVNY